MAPQCQALHLSDERRCTEPATNVNGLFCHFHARQVMGLYKGYKRRNKQYDDLVAKSPANLADPNTPLSKVSFDDAKDEKTLRQLHHHLFLRHALLDRVIRARKLHHSRFYALELDYGHHHFLDHLSNQKHTVLRALERLERRTAEVLYEKQKWFKWVRALEDDEEKERDAEKKKVKQEAALFKRHWKEVQVRLRELRAKEDEKRQAEFLDKAWQERKALDEESADEEWDPIDDVLEDERGSYIDLIKKFLWQETVMDAMEKSGQVEEPVKDVSSEAAPAEPAKSSESAALTKNARKKANQKAKKAAVVEAEGPKPKPGEVHIETAGEMRQRLREGVKVKHAYGWHVQGSVENPPELADKTAPIPDDEINRLLEEISEIKQLLFCRILLSHAALLPAALRASSIEDFIKDEEVTNTDLRDLALKMEQPDLQALRDACADLGRNDPEEDDDADKQVAPQAQTSVWRPMFNRLLPESWQSQREKEMPATRQRSMPDAAGQDTVDFGQIDDAGQYRIKRIRVKVCGKWIYNYPSDKAMARGGWLHFSIIAKECSLFDAVELCKSWDEFFELNILSCYQYFPASHWSLWGFIPYQQMSLSDKMTMHHQTGARSSARRSHKMFETRNFICANLKRNDPVSRRVIQYMALEASSMVLLVRDGKTGEFMVRPPESELWLMREKSGIGRATRNTWNVIKSVGPEFFEEMEKHRNWHFGFKDYYDVVIWDTEPGNHFSCLYNSIQTCLIKAHRISSGVDMYRSAEPVLRTIARDPTTQRAKDIKPDEVGKINSIWDDINSPTHRLFYWNLGADEISMKEAMPNAWRYTEADRLEDEVLFPEEFGLTEVGEVDRNKLLADQRRGGRGYDFEHNGPDFMRFVNDLDTDDELNDDEREATKREFERGTKRLEKRGGRRLGWEEIEEDEDEDEVYDFEDDKAEHSGDADEISIDTGSDWEDEEDEDYDFEDYGLSAMVIANKQIASGIPYGGRLEDGRTYNPELFKGMMEALTDWTDPENEPMPLGFRPDGSRMTIEEQDEQIHGQFMIHVEREGAASFKEHWHAADLEPGAQERYREANSLIAAYEKWCKQEGPIDLNTIKATRFFRLFAWLGVSPEDHRRVHRDMHRAETMIGLFMDDERAGFLASEAGNPFAESKLFDQDERSHCPPDRRSSHSNKYRPKVHWAAWDAILDQHIAWRRDEGITTPEDPYPDAWNLIVRPTLAHFYKEGIVCPSYDRDANGLVVVLTEPHRPDKPDVFFDWRDTLKIIRMSPHLEDPTTQPPLLERAQRFAAANPGAVFSVLRVWSAPHFWPLMLGADNRDPTSFADAVGRAWQWKFIPKDMPFSEVSMHQALKGRLAPLLQRAGVGDGSGNGSGSGSGGAGKGMSWYWEGGGGLRRGGVAFRKDVVLVMGADREECRALSVAVAWCIGTRPWRLEIDLWKSWVGVGVGVLEGMEGVWWE
ncbi:uncharacterized protein K452DRAFT_322524 [Aplosporella prunicola CBS 121167]|uniref:Uncharacterized protein n=1 Tax=Aplosporella prunicola CBS 121167 TaxID=1176127 RepID=A0A6A6B0N3_9PEZI|nr:uncharacterized protein K452DRAFT_322524 [Aplosporella prunicola CBS 121167]KAF2136281.1 hypothetical protein K452DRAFT_322524 [Aplosporella prunicola CBS 121167]